MLGVLRGHHLVWYVYYATDVELLGTSLELDVLKDIHVDTILTISNWLRVSLLPMVVKNINNPLIVNQYKIAEQHAICISFKLL